MFPFAPRLIRTFTATHLGNESALRQVPAAVSCGPVKFPFPRRVPARENGRWLCQALGFDRVRYMQEATMTLRLADLSSLIGVLSLLLLFQGPVAAQYSHESLAQRYGSGWENDQLRVRTIAVEPGAQMPAQADADRVLVFLTADLQGRSPAAEAVWQPAGTQELENRGSRRVEAVLIELKNVQREYVRHHPAGGASGHCRGRRSDPDRQSTCHGYQAAVFPRHLRRRGMALSSSGRRRRLPQRRLHLAADRGVGSRSRTPGRSRCRACEHRSHLQQRRQ